MKKVQGNPQPLGVRTIKGKTNFAVAVPASVPCELLLYECGAEEPVERIVLSEAACVGEVRYIALENFQEQKYEYNYLIDGKLVTDPYAKVIHRVKDASFVRGAFLKEYDWEGDRPLQIPYQDVIAYSLHVRGFTKHRMSHVKKKGTFRGIMEKIPYLLELGINQIQCMPVYEFEDRQQGRVNYWGYGPAYFFAPKASFAAAKDVCTEFRDLVKECHRAGIEVVLDLPFEEGVNPQMVTTCLEYYVMEYHVDGFILNQNHAPMQEILTDPYLKQTKIMKKEEQFQNIMRRFLKGDEGMVGDVIRELKRLTNQDGCFNYITNHTGFTMQDLVSYDGKHNELNGERNQDGPDYNFSWNCGAEGPTRKKDVLALRKNQVRNAFALLLTAQGTPCILAGDEFGNSQKGNNNVYCQDNELAWLNWNQLKREEELFQYVKALIALRKAIPLLHMEKPLLGMDYTACGLPDVSYHGESAWQTPSEVSSRLLGVFYSGSGMTDQVCFVVYNMHWLEHKAALPGLGKGKKWYLVMETEEGVLAKERLLKNQKELWIKARTIQILVGR